jgi:hypothetical protein
MMRIVIVAMVVAVVGCKSQTPPRPMDGKACEASVPAAIDRVMADYAKDPRVVAVIDKAKSEMTSLCVADEWPPAVGTTRSTAQKWVVPSAKVWV